MATTDLRAPRTAGAGRLAAVGTMLGAVVVAVLLDTVIAQIAEAAGVSGFKPLQFGSYTSLTVLGMVAATVGWAVVRRRSSRPADVLRRLVPAVLVLSFVPDVALLVGGGMGATGGGVAALLLMHVAVAAVVVAALHRVLPVR